MAPYLLFGFLFSGIISELISKKIIINHLGKSSRYSYIKAVLLGVPMPICSCGVLPLAATLKNHGASKSATSSFIVSTPQTGIDSIAVTYGLLGPFFAFFRLLIAFISGFITGFVIELIDHKNNKKNINNDINDNISIKNKVSRILHYGFIRLPENLSKPLIIGLILAGIIDALIPNNILSHHVNNYLISIILILLIGIPLYICSTASVPLAVSFIDIGFSPGCALIFLIVGPATNITNLTTIWKIIGRKTTIVLIVTICLCAVISGLIMDYFINSLSIPEKIHNHNENHDLLKIVSTIILYIMLLFPFIFKKINKQGGKPDSVP